MSRFGILVSDNQATPIYRANVGPYVDSVKVSTMLPGGASTLSFRLRVSPRGTIVVPSFFGFNFQVRVTDGNGVFWAGRMEDVELTPGPEGRSWQVTAYGYGVSLSDQFYTSTDVSNKATSTIVSDAISTLAPQIGATSITATGFTISAATAVNLTFFNAAAVIAWAARFGDSSFNPQLWYVYPDNDGTIRFTFKPRGTTPEVEGYVADFDEPRFGLKGRQLADRGIIQYNSGASSSTANDTTLQGAGPTGWNLTRTIAAIIPEVTQAADAAQAASAILAAAKAIRLSATGLRMKYGAHLLDSNGIYLDPWRVRSGQIFRFRDILVNVQPGTNLAFTDSFLIAGTDWDEDAQTLTITPESYEVMLERSAAQVRQVLQGRLRP